MLRVTNPKGFECSYVISGTKFFGPFTSYQDSININAGVFVNPTMLTFTHGGAISLLNVEVSKLHDINGLSHGTFDRFMLASEILRLTLSSCVIKGNSVGKDESSHTDTIDENSDGNIDDYMYSSVFRVDKGAEISVEKMIVSGLYEGNEGGVFKIGEVTTFMDTGSSYT